MFLPSSLKFLQSHTLYVQFSKFVVVGMISALINYSSYFILLYMMQLHVLICSAVAFLCGTLIGYKLNAVWSFQAESHHRSLLIKYLCVYLCSLLLSLSILYILVNILDMNPYLAQLAVIAITTCTNFIGIKFWVFI